MITLPGAVFANKHAILSLGGSLVVPDEVNVTYLKEFRSFILSKITEGWSFVLVVGGGAQARRYIDAATQILDKEITKDDQDWLGIHATRFNGHLVRTIFRSHAQPALVTHPEDDEIDSSCKLVVASGWKPGWSTDYVASKLAHRLKAKLIINLTNISQVFTADPKKDPGAKPLDQMLWSDFCAMVGDKWVPGMNAPFDPVAASLCCKENIAVAVMAGDNLANLSDCLSTRPFLGTLLTN